MWKLLILFGALIGLLESSLDVLHFGAGWRQVKYSKFEDGYDQHPRDGSGFTPIPS